MASFTVPVPESQPSKAPDGWEPGCVISGDTGEIVTAPLAEPPSDWAPLLAEWGVDTAIYEVDPDRPVEWRGWEAFAKGAQEPTKLRRFRCYLRLRTGVRTADDLADLAELRKAAAKKSSRWKRPKTTDGVALVVCLSDWQLGKRGTPESIDAIHVALDKAADLCRQVKPSVVWLNNLGDLTEGVCGFYTHQPNDVVLNSSQQDEVARRLGMSAIDRFAHLPTIITAAPSNHGENRIAKRSPVTDPLRDNRDVLWLWQLAHICEAAPQRYETSTFIQPADRECYGVAVEVAGVRCGAIHGHQISGANPVAGAETWLLEQERASSNRARKVMAGLDILFAGHRHHFAASEATGPTVFQAPAMDSGSDWWTASHGADNPRGLMCVTVGEAFGRRGWGSVHVL